MIGRKKGRTARIGIFAVAHATYWDQFPGLEANIMGFHKDFCEMVKKQEVEVEQANGACGTAAKKGTGLHTGKYFHAAGE